MFLRCFLSNPYVCMPCSPALSHCISCATPDCRSMLGRVLASLHTSLSLTGASVTAGTHVPSGREPRYHHLVYLCTVGQLECWVMMRIWASDTTQWMQCAAVLGKWLGCLASR